MTTNWLRFASKAVSSRVASKCVSKSQGYRSIATQSVLAGASAMTKSEMRTEGGVVLNMAGDLKRAIVPKLATPMNEYSEARARTAERTWSSGPGWPFVETAKWNGPNHGEYSDFGLATRRNYIYNSSVITSVPIQVVMYVYARKSRAILVIQVCATISESYRMFLIFMHAHAYIKLHNFILYVCVCVCISILFTEIIKLHQCI